jgi:isopenicillin-N N-acyltransferase-like protein
MIEVGPRLMENDAPTLPAAKGKVQVVARSGAGRLEVHDGARVLFLKGTPEEMGRQHGELLRDEVREVMERVLYGVGVGSSFAKGRWFFGEVEEAQARVNKFVDPRVLKEMDALAAAAGVHPQESRLANFFPELFHCSGFALTGKATKDGHVYHGRVLDYMRGVGLETQAVTVVYQPTDGRHAWANVTYAGFVGSVTAMNAKGISVGEMGGRGAGDWDGKPMAQLVREVMEQAGTLDEAVAIMRKGPRTCEYYYVVSDGNSKQAVGIAATPTTFEVVKLGESHPRLPHGIKDAVLLSAGSRYETLVDRVKAGYGKFDDASARELMTRPVAMTSCIQAVLFAPDTLDFWVANADSKNVASHTRYTRYNLAELLTSSPTR